MTRVGSVFGSRIVVVALAPTLAVACGETVGDRTPAPPDGTGPIWTSEPQYKIGDAVEGDALFHIIRTVRVGRDRERVFVTEPGLSRVSVWTPDGHFLFDVGGVGEGPGDLASPTHVYPHDSGFVVRERWRFSHFSADGELVSIATFPGDVSYQGFQISMEGLLPDGSFLGRPWLSSSVMMGLWGDDPIETLPLLRIAESERGWSKRTLIGQNVRNRTLWYRLPNGAFYSVQPFSDADLYEADPVAGTFVLARNVGGGLRAGEAETLEIAATGDTLWQRRLQFEPLPLAGPVLDEAIRRELEDVNRLSEQDPGFLGGRSAREVLEEALHLPEYLPAVKRFFLTSFSEEVWIQSHERVDTLSVWYTIPRGEDEAPPRRVLLPSSFWAHDATETHVWGVWRDELDVNYAVGRRLVPDGGRP